MSALAGLGVLAALAVVVALLLLGARAAQRLGIARPGADAGLRVLRRLPLGPKQGIALVQIADRVIAVSVGEGGIRPVLELSEDDAERFTLPAPAPIQFRHALEKQLKKVRAAAGTVALSLALALALALGADAASAQAPATRANAPAAAGVTSPQAPAVSLSLGSGAQDGLEVSGTVGTVLVLGALTMLPAVLLLMTGFTRILIVLHLLRQALGTQSAPPGQLLTALALIITGFVMAPTLTRVNQEALVPWLDGRTDELTMLKGAIGPLRDFMLEQTPEGDVAAFVELAGSNAASETEVPTTVLAAAFATSELRAAFQMGFAIFLPFVVIDLVVAAVLSGMGMFMLPPTMIALPCKLLLFVLVDGWTLTVQSLVRSFGA